MEMVLLILIKGIHLNLRIFIGIIGISAYGCDYLYNRLYHWFLDYGGVIPILIG